MYHPKKYRIVDAWDRRELEDHINNLFRSGWVVDGEMVVMVVPQGFWAQLVGKELQWRFYQRMVKPMLEAEADRRLESVEG